MTYEKFLQNAKGTRSEKQLAKSFVEGFNAAEAKLISTAAVALEDQAASEIEGERQFQIPKGYDGLLRHLLEGLPTEHLLLQTAVKEIRWKSGSVEVYAQSLGRKRVYRGARALVTLPLDVLRASRGTTGAVRFVPAIPQKTKALKRLEMGEVRKIVLCFKKKFWREHGRFGFIMASRVDFPVWWSREPGNSLTGWAGGPAAKRLANYSMDEITNCALHSLGKIFNISISKMKENAGVNLLPRLEH